MRTEASSSRAVSTSILKYTGEGLPVAVGPIYRCRSCRRFRAPAPAPGGLPTGRRPRAVVEAWLRGLPGLVTAGRSGTFFYGHVHDFLAGVMALAPE